MWATATASCMSLQHKKNRDYATFHSDSVTPNWGGGGGEIVAWGGGGTIPGPSSYETVFSVWMYMSYTCSLWQCNVFIHVCTLAVKTLSFFLFSLLLVCYTRFPCAFRMSIYMNSRGISLYACCVCVTV